MATRQPSPSAVLSAYLSRFSPGSVALAKRCLAKLRRTFPGATQLVYDYRHSVVIAFGVSERGSEAVVALAVYPRWVRLYFGAGKSLPDPEGRLEGSATKVRYVALTAASDLDHRDVRALFKAAIQHAGVTFPRSRPPRIVIKSGSKKRKPGRTGRA
jgi:hypothetical protein